MTEQQEKQESQKTLVAFVAGLLIGGLLVWVFGGTPEQKVKDEPDIEVPSEQQDVSTIVDTSKKEAEVSVAEEVSMKRGEGSITVSNQAAGNSVVLDTATFPNDEGWIGVRDYVNGQPAGLLGVVRFSNEQGLVPETIVLQRATQAGNTYAVVFYTESGDRTFSLANDVQVEGVFATFTAK